jgi:hypothetical protein
MTSAEATFSAEVDEYCPVRPERLAVRPTGDGQFEIEVRWAGHESVLRAVFVRRMLAQAGVKSHPSSFEGGRVWVLRIGPVPADRVGELIHSCIW